MVPRENRRQPKFMLMGIKEFRRSFPKWTSIFLVDCIEELELSKGEGCKSVTYDESHIELFPAGTKKLAVLIVWKH